MGRNFPATSRVIKVYKSLKGGFAPHVTLLCTDSLCDSKVVATSETGVEAAGMRCGAARCGEAGERRGEKKFFRLLRKTGARVFEYTAVPRDVDAAVAEIL